MTCPIRFRGVEIVKFVRPDGTDIDPTLLNTIFRPLVTQKRPRAMPSVLKWGDMFYRLNNNHHPDAITYLNFCGIADDIQRARGFEGVSHTKQGKRSDALRMRLATFMNHLARLCQQRAKPPQVIRVTNPDEPDTWQWNFQDL